MWWVDGSCLRLSSILVYVLASVVLSKGACSRFYEQRFYLGWQTGSALLSRHHVVMLWYMWIVNFPHSAPKSPLFTKSLVQLEKYCGSSLFRRLAVVNRATFCRFFFLRCDL